MIGVVVLVVAMVASFVVFVAGRWLATVIARVPDRLAPFGEAPLARIGARGLGTRLAVTLAGPLAVYLFLVALSSWGIYLNGVRDETKFVVDEVITGSPAAEAGLRAGDRIVTVGGQPLSHERTVSDAVSGRAGESVDVSVERGSQTIVVPVVPVASDDSGRGRIGIRLGPVMVDVSMATAVRLSLPRPFEAMSGYVTALSDPTIHVAGPVGIVSSINANARQWSATGVLTLTTLIAASDFWLYLLASLLLFPWRMRAPTAPPAPAPASTPGLWARFVARVIDLMALSVVLAAATLASDAVRRVENVFGPMLLFLWIPIEAVLMATWGYTPGKALLGISVRDAHGSKLRPGQAFRRAALVYWYGFAANKLLVVVTGSLALFRLGDHGATYWDALDDLRVEHRPIGRWRAVFAIGVVALAVITLVVRGLGLLPRGL
jgi:membrane-associated protease RseP (regulator of RpoE activity)